MNRLTNVALIFKKKHNSNIVQHSVPLLKKECDQLRQNFLPRNSGSRHASSAAKICYVVRAIDFGE